MTLQNNPTQISVIDGLREVLEKNTVVHLSGKSGTGKTSFALYLIGQLLKDDDYGIWIQASESFPKKRFEIMYGTNQKHFNVLKNQLLVTPEKSFSSFENQSRFMKKFGSEEFLYPPDVQFIVIDNISHHLRFHLSNIKEIGEKVFFLDNFYSSELQPLILRCSRERIALILIHEVSFNMRLKQNLPFFNKLYERIKGINIVLRQSPITKKLVMEFMLESN